MIAVSGMDRQPGMPSHVCRLGWFAIPPQIFSSSTGRCQALAAVAAYVELNFSVRVGLYADPKDYRSISEVASC
jgi:hypothetical protein